MPPLLFVLPLLLAADDPAATVAPPATTTAAPPARAPATEALAATVRALLLTRGPCLPEAVEVEIAAAAAASPGDLPALEEARRTLRASCPADRACVAAVDDVNAVEPGDHEAMGPVLRHARLSCRPDSVLGLWSEALALDRAGLGEQAAVYREDALALAKATEPALLPRLEAQARPATGPPPPPRADPDLPPWTCLAGSADAICVALGPCVDALLAAREVGIAAEPGLLPHELDAQLGERFAAREQRSVEAARACTLPEGSPALRAAGLAAKGLVAADFADALDAVTPLPSLDDEARAERRVMLGYRAAEERRTAGILLARAAVFVPGAYAERGRALEAEGVLTEEALIQELIRDNLRRFGQPVPPPSTGDAP